MDITPTLLYNYIRCPHRPWRDKYGPQSEKLPPNEFLKLLWEKGVKHEQKIVGQLGPYEDMTKYPYRERQNMTLRAMKDGAELIYRGQLAADGLKGEPDLLRKIDSSKHKYIAIDIKSGRGYEGGNGEEEDSGRPKKHYAVQLCLYTDILERLGYSPHRKGIILDIDNEEFEYVLSDPIGVRNSQTYWDLYTESKEELTLLLDNKVETTPAYSGSECKFCHWHASCKNWVKDNDDMSQIYRLGRSIRDTLKSDLEISTVDDLLTVDVADVLSRKHKGFLVGIGESKLNSAVNRARVLRKVKRPVSYKAFTVIEADYELFFDIEADPTQDHVYLHGVLERCDGRERFVSFLAENIDPEEERSAWAKFWEYIGTLGRSYAVYHYSSYERTTYKHLCKKYPDVISLDKVDEFFDNSSVVDLYRYVDKYTDWPLMSYSLKDIAMYLGFQWRDEDPSGANSIRWYNEFIASGEDSIMKRILEYNEDDCRATMVLKDYLCSDLRFGAL